MSGAESNTDQGKSNTSCDWLTRRQPLAAQSTLGEEKQHFARDPGQGAVDAKEAARLQCCQ